MFLVPSQDLRTGGRQSKALYQYTVSDSDVRELDEWMPKILERLQQLPQLADVSTDSQQGGLKANVVIDRNAASRMGVQIATLDAALNSAFGQRQDSIIYTQRNNYRVVVEVPPTRQRDIRDLSGVYVTSANGTQVPLTALAHIERGNMPLVVNHQGVVPAITITFNLATGTSLEQGTTAIVDAVSQMNLPRGLRTAFAGDAADFRKTVGGMGLIILAALVAGLHHPRHSLRELHSSDHDHLDLALGGRRRLAGAGVVRRGIHGDRLHRHSAADRHRQEERHHARRLRAARAARAGHERA